MDIKLILDGTEIITKNIEEFFSFKAKKSKLK